MRWFAIFGVLIIFIAMYNLQGSSQTAIPGEPVQGEIPGETPLANFIEIGYVEARFYSLELGEITIVDAYDNLPIQLTDDDGDGIIEATFGIKCRIWSFSSIPKGVLIICGIWGPSGYPYNWPLAGFIPVKKEGWNDGVFTTNFRCRSDETGRYIVHLRAICFIDWGNDTGSLIINSGSNESYGVKWKLIRNFIANDAVNITARE